MYNYICLLRLLDLSLLATGCVVFRMEFQRDIGSSIVSELRRSKFIVFLLEIFFYVFVEHFGMCPYPHYLIDQTYS